MRSAIRRLFWKQGGFQLLLAARLVQLPLRAVIGAVVRLVPRESHLVAFGAERDRFGDNAAYLFLAMQASPVRSVWITGSGSLVKRLRGAGLRAERRWSYRGLLTCLHAGSYVVSSHASDVNGWLAEGTRVVNLWHGVPLKRIERDIVGGPLRRMYDERQPIKAAFRERTRPPDLLLAPSVYIAERCFEGAFAVPRERCLAFGYPRTDHFFEQLEVPPHELLVADRDTWLELRRRTRVVGYFPTWRDGSIEAAPVGLHLEQFAAGLAERGAHLVFKPHFVAFPAQPVRGATTLGEGDDADAYLPLCDLLVTDYSSLAFDFMLLDRPIVYFAPDLQDYTRERGFYFDPLEMMPGNVVRDPARLLDAVAAALEAGPDPRLHAVRKLVWGDYEGGACEQLRRLLASEMRSATV